MSKSLYIKYRPQNFNDVIGQITIKKILQNSILNDKINHAYLVYGIRGTGKTTLARIFAKAVNCINLLENVEPCNECGSCVQISNSSSLDVIEIDAASNNGVDEIRDITEKANYLTTSSKYKIYIIDEVHMLSKAAFNALLKTLEEPPKNTIFILATTEINKLPDTIVSRTLVLNLESLTISNIEKGLRNILTKEDIPFEKEALEYIASVSGGSLRDAISFLEMILLSTNNVTKNEVITLLGLIDYDEVKKNIILSPVKLIDKIDNDDKDPRKTLYMLINVVTNIVKEGRSDLNILLTDLLDILLTLKDPSLIKIALKSTIVKWMSTHMITADVPRETIVEAVEKNFTEETDLLNTKELELVNLKTEEVKFADDLIKRKKLKEKNVIVDHEQKTEEKNNTAEEKTNIEPLVKEAIIIEKVLTTDIEKQVEIDDSFIVEENNKITDYVNAKHYISVLFEWDDIIFNSVKERWNYIEQYQSKTIWKKYVSILHETEVLAASSKVIILGFSSVHNYENFKEVSLEPKLLKFIKELTGRSAYVLPVMPEQWKKIVIGHKQLANQDNIINIEIDIPEIEIETNEEKTLKDLFGEKVEYKQ